MPSGSYSFVFATGQVIAVQCTLNSAQLSWSTPLSAAIPTTVTPSGEAAFFGMQQSFEHRPLLSNAMFSSARGAPLEACVALCNALDMDLWLNLPAATNTVTANAFATSAARLVQSSLSKSRKCYVELSNECWGTYSSSHLMIMMGVAVFPGASPGGTGVWGAGQEWMGTQVAAIADAWADVYGDEFDQRVLVSMGGQFAPGNGQAFMEAALNTPDWSSRAYTHHIGGLHFAPYWYLTQGSPSPDRFNADAAAILATASPLDTLFALAYSNSYQGVTYASIAASGYIGVMTETIRGFMQPLSGQPWASLPLLAYESGDGLGWFGAPDGWQAVMQSFQRDPRFALLYYDAKTGKGYLPLCKAAGFQSMNQFTDVALMFAGGQWGVLESIMQPINPLEAAPAKYQGFATYIAGDGKAQRGK